MLSIYAPNATDFSMNGLGLLLPIECTIEEQANGLYELTIVHPITDDHRWAQIQNGCIIKAEAPKRESPLYEIEAFTNETTTTTIKRKLYKVRVNTRLRLRAKPNTSSKILGRYKNGTEVVQLKDMGNDWFQVMIRKGGATGYMSSKYLTYSKEITETVTTTKPVTREGISVLPTREQLFRIYSTEVNTDAHTVTAKAMHIFYDLRGNPVNKAYSPKNTNANTAAQTIFDSALLQHDFDLYAHLTGTVTGDYGYKSIPEILLDPDEGIVAQTGGMLVRDNFDVFLLPDAVRDMGVTIRRGKNLIGVTVATDMTDVVTRIIPVGANKKGNDLFLDGTKYVDSPRIGNYPTVLAKRIDYDVKVGDGEGQFSSDAKARTELRKRAQADFDAGADLPTYGMEVDFILLGNTAEYADYASLQAVHLFDTVTVIDELVGLRAKLRVTGYKWDVLGERYESVTLGELQDLQQTTHGYTIAPGTISGAKLINNSVGGNVLRDLSIQYAKIAQATIEQLNADSITALTARINEIVAGSITTDTLYAALAEITTLMVKSITADKIETDELYAALADIILLRAEQINAGNITTDKLAAQYAEIVALLVENIKAEEIQTDRLGAVLAEFVSMYASVGEFDFATIQNLVAKALALEQGSMDTVYIKNLAVTSANLLSATLGKLVLKGDDGKYYRVFVGADGEVRTEEVELTEEEIADGKTEGGQQIVETDMNVGSLNASNLQANSAIINEILTIALTAEKITAADAMIASATIPALYATTIKAIGDSLDLSANISIRQMVSGRSKIFYQEDMPEEYDPGNLWIIPSTGKTYHAIGLPGGSLTEIVVNDDFEFVFRYPPEAEGLDFLIDRYGDLLTNTEYIQLDEDGTLYAFRGWVEVPVSELHTSYIDIMQDVIRIRSGGNIEIGAGGTFNVDAGSAHFKTSDFALSILAEDGSEDTVLDFDAGSKTLRADEVKAENIRDFFPGTTTVTAAEIGGLDGLAGMLAAAQYEHVVYTQTTSDASSEVIEFNACDSMLVEIEGFTGCVVPPLAFNRLTGRMLLKNLSWNCPEQTALYADSGNVMLRRCTADAQTGVHATGNANVVWIGDDEAMTAGGACTTAFLADEGADVKLFGLIPSGERTKTLAGTITEINVRTGAGVEVDQPDKTVTIKATLGYYGTNSGWDSGAMYQGYTSGKGRIYGCMQFDLPDDIAQIKAATLTLHRVSGAGSGSNINVTVYASATEFRSRPSLGDQVAHRDKAAGTGESCTLDVTEGAKALLDGTAKQLVLYTGETKTASGVVYSRHYGKFDSAKLKITY